MTERASPPSARKLREASERGERPRSPVPLAALSLALAWLCVPHVTSRLHHGFQHLFASALGAAPSPRSEALVGSLGDALALALGALAPPLAAAFVGAVAGAWLQGGLSLKRPRTPLGARSSLARYGRLRTWLEPSWQASLGLALAAVGLVTVAPLALAGAPSLPALVGRWEALGDALGTRALSLAAVAAVLELAWRRWLFLRDQRMTRAEVKREAREDEGAPELRGERARARQEALQGPLSEVLRRARCVVTDGDRLAVAWRYTEEDPAPVVVARGEGPSARVVRSLASRAGVPLVEAPALTKALSRVALGEALPRETWEPAASVLVALDDRKEPRGEGPAGS